MLWCHPAHGHTFFGRRFAPAAQGTTGGATNTTSPLPSSSGAPAEAQQEGPTQLPARSHPLFPELTGGLGLLAEPAGLGTTGEGGPTQLSADFFPAAPAAPPELLELPDPLVGVRGSIARPVFLGYRGLGAPPPGLGELHWGHSQNHSFLSQDTQTGNFSHFPIFPISNSCAEACPPPQGSALPRPPSPAPQRPRNAYT